MKHLEVCEMMPCKVCFVGLSTGMFGGALDSSKAGWHNASTVQKSDGSDVKSSRYSIV